MISGVVEPAFSLNLKSRGISSRSRVMPVKLIRLSRTLNRLAEFSDLIGVISANFRHLSYANPAMESLACIRTRSICCHLRRRHRRQQQEHLAAMNGRLLSLACMHICKESLIKYPISLGRRDARARFALTFTYQCVLYCRRYTVVGTYSVGNSAHR